MLMCAAGHKAGKGTNQGPQEAVFRISQMCWEDIHVRSAHVIPQMWEILQVKKNRGEVEKSPHGAQSELSQTKRKFTCRHDHHKTRNSSSLWVEIYGVVAGSGGGISSM